MKLKLYSAPASEPVTVDECKSHMHISGTDDDTYLGTLVTAARQEAEAYTRRAFITQTWELVLDVAPCEAYVELPRGPLVSVSSVTWYDEDDTATVLSSSTEYRVDTYSDPGRVVLRLGQVWPTTSDMRTASGLIIRYVAGYGAASDVPGQIKTAVKQLVKAAYDDDAEAREAGMDLLAPYRVPRL